MVDKTKKAVKEALLEIMREKDFNQITVNELIKKAGISRGTFYTHFSNIEDVRQQLIEELYARADNFFSGCKAGEILRNPSPTLLMAARYMKESSDPSKRLFKYLNVYNLNINLKTWLTDFILGDEEFVADLGGNKQAEIYARFIAGGIMHAFNMWLADPCDVDAEFIAQSLSGILTGGLNAAMN